MNPEPMFKPGDDPGDVVVDGLPSPADVRILDPGAPLDSAQTLVGAEYMKGDGRTLHHWQGGFFIWTRSAYREAPGDDIKATIWRFLDAAHIEAKGTPVRFRPKRNHVADLVDALKAATNISAQHAPPCWLDGRQSPAPTELIGCTNGLLHLPTLELLNPTPAYFGFNALDFAYSPTAPVPQLWVAFLDELWPDDQESIETLQEIFGYCLTADTSLQKLFLIVGPKRSGKGTIARVMAKLIGADNIAGPTLSSLAQPFGLAPLVGKLLAIIADARLGNRADQAAIAERLLAISGEDALSIPRKFRDDLTTKLAARFLILSNELPRLADTSGALASRFIVLNLERSFYGKEDPGLTSRLLCELPGILNWAVEGWKRLQARGHFVQPASALEAVRELEDLGSPIAAFLRDRCEMGPACEVECQHLFMTWKTWCTEQGRDHPGTLQNFGRDLRAAVPGLQIVRPRSGETRNRRYRGVGL